MLHSKRDPCCVCVCARACCIYEAEKHFMKIFLSLLHVIRSGIFCFVLASFILW